MDTIELSDNEMHTLLPTVFKLPDGQPLVYMDFERIIPITPL